MITWVQAALLGLMSCTAASIPAALGTTIGNYTLNRPLIASLFVGLILGDVEGCIKLAIPMQIIYIAVVTPGGTVAADLRAVSYIGIPLAYATAKSQGLDLGGPEAQGLAGSIGALVGTVGFWYHNKGQCDTSVDFSYTCILYSCYVDYLLWSWSCNGLQNRTPNGFLVYEITIYHRQLTACCGDCNPAEICSKQSNQFDFLPVWIHGCGIHAFNTDCGNCCRCCIRTDQLSDDDDSLERFTGKYER